MRDAQSKATLKSVACELKSLGENNPVWGSTENSVNHDVRRAIVKLRLLTGLCLLQTNIHEHRFSQYREDPVCTV